MVSQAKVRGWAGRARETQEGKGVVLVKGRSGFDPGGEEI